MRRAAPAAVSSNVHADDGVRVVEHSSTSHCGSWISNFSHERLAPRKRLPAPSCSHAPKAGIRLSRTSCGAINKPEQTVHAGPDVGCALLAARQYDRSLKLRRPCSFFSNASSPRVSMAPIEPETARLGVPAGRESLDEKRSVGPLPALRKCASEGR